jgi:electron transfer flavoprotein alpha subunit
MTRLRRDPRTERAARLVSSGPRPRYAMVAPESRRRGRPRRDPRDDHAAALVPGTVRRRLDRTRSPGEAAPASASQTPAAIVGTAPEIRAIAEPAFFVLAVLDAPGGRLTAHDRQLLGAARSLAESSGAVIAVLTAPCDELGPAGADRTIVVSNDRDYDPEGSTETLAGIARGLSPRHILFAESGDGGDLARRLAARLGEALFPEVESLSPHSVSRPARGRSVEQRIRPPRLMTLAADMIAPHSGARHEARPIPFDAAPLSKRAIVETTRLAQDPETIPLTEADFVISAGNGVTDFTRFAELARAIGATPGASRVVCDAGLMPRHRQVGASGSLLDATCYVAFGISGAPQHLQGLGRVAHVVAVNTDLHAAMIKRADLAIVADAQKVMPALLRRLASGTHGGSDGEGSMKPLPSPTAVERDPDEDRRIRNARNPLVRPTTSTHSPENGVKRHETARTMRAVALLSVGRHPASGRARAACCDAQAIGLAAGLGAEVFGLHAGPDETPIRDYFGHGLIRAGMLSVSHRSDPVPALVATLMADPPDLVVAGRRSESGAGTGMVPYAVAAALGWPTVADAVAARSVEHEGEAVLEVEQALARGQRRSILVHLPAVVVVHPIARPPQPFAFAAARRGRLDCRPGIAVEEMALEVSEKPYRPKPRLIAGAKTSGSVADRLKTATEAATGSGTLLVDPDPDMAAEKILAFLTRIGVRR